MGVSTLIIGESGRGKSRSIKELNPEEVMLIKVINKPLPFKGKEWKEFIPKESVGSVICTDDYQFIKKIIRDSKERTGRRIIVIDDVQYLMANDFMRRSDEKGFDYRLVA